MWLTPFFLFLPKSAILQIAGRMHDDFLCYVNFYFSTLGATMKIKLFSVLLSFLAPLAFSAHAADVSLSGFGTIGYAQSNQPYNYETYINKNGTFTRDTILGVQLDTKFTPQWSATAQAKVAPSVNADNQWQPTLSWAFISWRPDNDWLLRLGKLRVPLYLNSENMDIGTTFDFARLPVEVYSTTQLVDFNGAAFSKTWDLNKGDLSLDGYWGSANTKGRTYIRDGVPGLVASGPSIAPLRIEAEGFTLNYRDIDNSYHLSLNKGTLSPADGQNYPNGPVQVNLAPGISYYNMLTTTSPLGQGVPGSSETGFSAADIGADISLGNNFRLITEFSRRFTNIESGLRSSGGYVSLLKHIDKWTPYLYYAKMRSDQSMLNVYQSLNNSSVPAIVPGAALINAAQRTFADEFVTFDQHSLALGTSYAVTPKSKIKAEWVVTHIGVASSLVDAPPGSNLSNQNINVFSLSYNFVF
jgi:hypothetical protein